MPVDRSDAALEPIVESIVDHIVLLLEQHAANTATAQFLAYVRKVVVTLAVDKCAPPMPGESSSNRSAQFLQRQLTTILDDTLTKYADQPISMCHDEMLVDISDAVFNELAYHRMMNNLQDSSSKKSGVTSKPRLASSTPRLPPIVASALSTFRAPESSASNTSPAAEQIHDEICKLVGADTEMDGN